MNFTTAAGCPEDIVDDFYSSEIRQTPNRGVSLIQRHKTFEAFDTIPWGSLIGKLGQ